MNTQDRLDDQLIEHLRTNAPRKAPDHLLEATMNRIASTPQGGAGLFGRPVVRLLAAAAVLLLAVAAGTQFAGLIGPPTGDDPSPSPSVAPSASVAPTKSAAPSASTPTSPSPELPATGDGLVLRIVAGGGGPTSSLNLLPTVSLMADGTLVWQTLVDARESPTLVTRMLTAQGLAELRDHIFEGGMLDESATYELEPQPGAEPPGRGVVVYTFTAGDGDDQVEVTSVQWLGDEEESTYYLPAPERQALDTLAQQLRDPESIIGADAWAGSREPYEATEYQLVLTPQRDAPPYDTADASEIPWPFTGPLDEFGAQTRDPATRCGTITADEASGIVDALVGLGFEQMGLDRGSAASIDWADGDGTADLILLPAMPDGYPDCGDL